MAENDELNAVHISEEEDVGADPGLVSCYEIGFHLPPTFSDTEISGYLEKIHTLLESNGALVIAEGHPELIDLAYPIQGQKTNVWFTNAYFGWIKFELPRAHILSIQTAFEADGSIVRFLLVAASRDVTIPFRKAVRVSDKPEKKFTQPSVVAPYQEISEEELDKAVEQLVGEPTTAVQ